MRRHLQRCPACSAQKAAEEALAPLLTGEFANDDPAEAEAVERVTRRWEEILAGPAADVRPPRRLPSRRLITASAVFAVAGTFFVVGAITAPRRAIGDVAASMAKVRRFHVVMEIPSLPTRYEGWGEREKGARVEEREDDELQMVILDDGKKMRLFYPGTQQVQETSTRLQSVFRNAAGFNATRMLVQSARGKLFEGQGWLGEATAREVSRIRRNGIYERRIQVDLKDGFFERMVIYAALPNDRLTQANLYMDSDSPDEEPFARVYFDYPDTIDPEKFKLNLPPGTRVGGTEPSAILPD